MAGPKWLEIAQGELDVEEAPGDADNPRVLEYYKAAGHPEIEHDSVAWCAAFACWAIEQAGYHSPKTLSARDFLRWGKPLDKPAVGAIVVLPRGRPSSYQGHVGFVIEEDATRVRVLSGNTGVKGGSPGRVGTAWYSKSRVLGYRWPVTGFNSTTAKSVVVGVATTALTGITGVAQVISASPDQAMGIANEVKSVAAWGPSAAVAGALITVAVLASIAWAHWADLKKNGK